MRAKRCLTLLLLVPAIAPAASSHRTRRAPARHAPTLALRRRMFVSSLIVEPGLGEFDCSVTSSTSNNTLFFPATLRYTPTGPSILWGRTEFSVSWDSAYSADEAQNRTYQFSDHVTLTGVSVLLDSKHWDLALAPQVTVLTRGASGVRVGGAGIARGDFGRDSVAMSASWTGATNPAGSDNPAGTFDWLAGYARSVGGGFTVYASAQWERSTGIGPQVSVFEGIQYSPNDRWGIELSGQHYAAGSSQTDNQMVLGITITLGRLKKPEPPGTSQPGSSGDAARVR